MTHMASPGRRSFLKGLACGAVSPLIGGCRPEPVRRPVVAGIRNRFTFVSPLIDEEVRFRVVGDTHLTVNDARGDEFLQYTRRMGGACPESAAERKSFRATLAAAKKLGDDLVALVGDQLSFPSPAGVEFLRGELDAAGVPWLYTSGNHDWHYEGMSGTEAELRAKYEPKILKPLYADGADPLAFTREVKGVRFVAIDDSTNEILPGQLEYWRKEVATGRPLVLLMHIPLYVPGYTVADGPVGHPEWGATTDPYYLIERRPQWPAEGHTAVTRAFRDEVFAAPNLIAVCTGHVHVLQCATAETGAVQLSCEANRKDAASLEITLLPSPRKNPPVEVLPAPVS